jgi:hypothetical protein
VRIGLILCGTVSTASSRARQPGAPGDSVEALAGRLLPVVESYRGLRFLRPVPVEVVTDSVARLHFAARMAKFYPEDALAAEALVYEHLGLLESGTDLPNLLLGVLEEQAGGYYDPEAETFYVLGDVPASLLEVVLVHELTHALDDQHFDVDSTFTALARDEDRQAAFGAVVEGSGTLVMAAYVVEALAAGSLGLEALLELQESGFGQAEQFAAAPPVVRCALLAPYVLGEAFLSLGDTATAAPPELDAAALDRAFRAPPVSTEQLLHPEKYWEEASRDVPRALPEADFGEVLGDAWRKQGTGVLGEVLVALLTGSEGPALDGLGASDSWTNPAATGWGNDRWELWTDGGRSLTTLLTCWDTEEDASEFVSAIRIPRAHVARRGDTVVVVCGDAPHTDEDVARAILAAVPAAGR